MYSEIKSSPTEASLRGSTGGLVLELEWRKDSHAVSFLCKQELVVPSLPTAADDDDRPAEGFTTGTDDRNPPWLLRICLLHDVHAVQLLQVALRQTTMMCRGLAELMQRCLQK